MVTFYFQKVQAGDEDGVKQYLRQNPQLVNLRDENSGFCPLHVAARYNFPNIVAILVDASAGLCYILHFRPNSPAAFSVTHSAT